VSAPPGGTGTRGTAPQPRPENVTASGTSGLQALQLEIQRYVLRADELAVDRVHDGVRATAGECLGIYAEAYRLRFLGVLRADYPALRALLGDDAFDALARDYIEDHPSRHFSVRHFGTDLADHLARHPRCRDRAYLSELAALEWTLGEAFDAADRQPLDQADLAAIPPADWGEMCLELHPSVNRLDLRWNAPALRQSFNEGEPMPPPAAAPDAVPWLVWRNGLETYFRSLSPDEAWALDAARRGLSFGDICDGLCEWIDEERAALRGAGLLHRWVTDGMVTGAGGAP
jgi:hypothetical protein